MGGEWEGDLSVGKKEGIGDTVAYQGWVEVICM